MNKLIKDINNVMGDFEGSQLTIRFFAEEAVVFGIYEQEFPIIVDKKSGNVYLDCETIISNITKDMLVELSDIIHLIEEKKELVLSCI